MKLSARSSGLLLFAAWIVLPLCAQQSSISTSSKVSPLGPMRLPGRTANGSGAREALTAPGTPHWSTDYKFLNETGLEGHSAVYDQTTNTMIVLLGYPRPWHSRIQTPYS